MGGGGFSEEPDNPLLDDFVMSLTGEDLPRVCFLPTASGDAEGYITKFYGAFGNGRCNASHLSLFNPPSTPFGEVLLSQDVVYVGGGSTPNMLALWRLHGIDTILLEAWQRGTVLCGLSAGSLCWFESGITDAFGRGPEVVSDLLGFLPGSHSPHWDSEPERRPVFVSAVATGLLPPGYAADDGAALHFIGTELHEAVASRPTSQVYRVDARGAAPLPTRLLGGRSMG